MKIHCRCGGTKFEVDVKPETIELKCPKCGSDFLTDFAPRILERIFNNLSKKFLKQ